MVGWLSNKSREGLVVKKMVLILREMNQSLAYSQSILFSRFTMNNIRQNSTKYAVMYSYAGKSLFCPVKTFMSSEC